MKMKKFIITLLILFMNSISFTKDYEIEGFVKEFSDKCPRVCEPHCGWNGNYLVRPPTCGCNC